MEIAATGERVVPGDHTSSPEDHFIYLMHAATYAFAEPYTRGRRVLDFGCGSGYGAAEIAKTASEVHAVDVAEDAISRARRAYPASNLHFQAISPSEALPFPDHAFDTVLSFQVVEHLLNASAYLAEARRVLAPGGRLLLATPDRTLRLFPWQRPWNRWHVQEFDERGLRRSLASDFEAIEILRLGGRPDLIDSEVRRCRKMKWLSLPFTLPLVPDAWRVAALSVLRRCRRSARPIANREFGFGMADIYIRSETSPALVLVAIASRRGASDPRPEE